ncbi:hypothetical protein BC834DRAFT_74944 [Gloeopeniophorella convolvens]|nr:hypothetical protein BC834DRAFT_74944 [Gloeopeniophorella convolvens]
MSELGGARPGGSVISDLKRSMNLKRESCTGLIALQPLTSSTESPTSRKWEKFTDLSPALAKSSLRPPRSQSRRRRRHPRVVPRSGFSTTIRERHNSPWQWRQAENEPEPRKVKLSISSCPMRSSYAFAGGEPFRGASKMVHGAFGSLFQSLYPHFLSSSLCFYAYSIMPVIQNMH